MLHKALKALLRDHPPFDRHNSSTAFFADMSQNYATYLQLVLTASCTNTCCKK